MLIFDNSVKSLLPQINMISCSLFENVPSLCYLKTKLTYEHIQIRDSFDTIFNGFPGEINFIIFMWLHFPLSFCESFCGLSCRVLLLSGLVSSSSVAQEQDKCSQEVKCNVLPPFPKSIMKQLKAVGGLGSWKFPLLPMPTQTLTILGHFWRVRQTILPSSPLPPRLPFSLIKNK